MDDEVRDADILKIAAAKGVLIEPDLLREINSNEERRKQLLAMLEAGESLPLVIGSEDITLNRGAEAERVGRIMSLPSEIKIVKDVTGNSTTTGNVSDFAKYFTDRFRRLKRIIGKRSDMVGAIPIEKAIQVDREVRVIGIVNSIRNTRNGNKVLEIEDEDERCNVYLINEMAKESVLKDEVIGVRGRMSQERKAIIASAIIRPDIAYDRTIEKSDSASEIAFLSDIHVGSKTFLRKEWERLVQWFKTEPQAREINYVVISGDLADGIGVYPNQEDDLELDDVYAQYERVAGYLSQLPDWVRIMIIPGNHDAVRPAEPQPAFSNDVRKLFDGSALFAGNPSTVDIEGRKLLAYHGRSFDDVISDIPHLGWDRPLDAMVELLKRRHLAPVYGEKTPLAAENRDFMVIEEVPDIFITGHVHSFGLSQYRGVRLISGSTWQSQTAYQKMRNIFPIPARMPVLKLSNLSMGVVNFAPSQSGRTAGKLRLL
ncbi:MAG: DNA-directed DNA polymerase II small subunit [Methanomassiliicoccales archaeon]